MINHDFLTN